jgi:hypothetical protein
MREFYKNPMLYYVLIPLLVAIWPLLIWAVYLPGAKQARDIETTLCVEGQTNVIEILKIDPDRPNITKETPVQTEFTYGAAVGRVANLCKIPANNCSYSAGGITVANGKKRQDCVVKLPDVSISQAAGFLWKIQSIYPIRLTCESAKLQAKRGMKDQWDVDFSFHYYY